MQRRKRRTWPWRPWRPGLAPELAWTPILAPWLTRTAGRPVLRPEAYQMAQRRLAAGFDVVLVAFDHLTPALKQAADALTMFTRSVSYAGGSK